jgi:hypothetical protein
MVFPEPGGPIIITLCLPATATSRQGFTCSWPLWYRRQNYDFLPSGVYAFSKFLNPLDYDPTYPTNPKTLADI